MPQSANLTKIGSRVKIDLNKVKDRISGNLVQKISSDPRATVMDYKMTDGIGGIGVVIKMNDGSKHWFFEDEVS